MKIRFRCSISQREYFAMAVPGVGLGSLENGFSASRRNRAVDLHGAREMKTPIKNWKAAAAPICDPLRKSHTVRSALASLKLDHDEFRLHKILTRSLSILNGPKWR
jgi:hypothetical protein